jgi:c(7)-type cytochrome triheme protein
MIQRTSASLFTFIVVVSALSLSCVSATNKSAAGSSAASSGQSTVGSSSDSGGQVQVTVPKSLDQRGTEKNSTDADEGSKVREPQKKLSIPEISSSVAPRNDGYHDNQNNAIVVLQSPTQALANFPRDRRMEVDWVKALDAGLIEPRADLLGQTQMQTMDMDILMKNTQFMPWVRFPHIAHTKWLACDNCHPKIFIPKQDANPISMNKVLRGEYCGVCHDKVAFSLFICERCHSVPHEGSGPKWW